jgi:acetoin utilization protein AcuC
VSRKTIIVHSPEYANWFFSKEHPTQGRRFINGYNAMKAQLNVLEPRPATDAELSRVHSPEYINQVLTNHTSFEWGGAREDLAGFAQLFAGGTLVALNALLEGSADLAIHLPGAKHHAQRDHSSGFCVFNDFAIAADIATKDHGLKVAILDIDAHHGDGVENLTADNQSVLTYSIHEADIFPGSGFENDIAQNVYNYPLTDKTGKSDSALLAGVNNFIEVANAFKPDLLFITCGADGLTDDPLTNLQYTVNGYAAAAALVAKAFPAIPFLMGGAGGYLPDSGTPEVWSVVASELAANPKNPN